MGICFSALMCHAPIVIPAVAGKRRDLCSKSTASMREVAQRMLRSAPDRLVLISPHSPRLESEFGAWKGPHVGNLSQFGCPEIGIQLPDAPEVAEYLGLKRIGIGKTLDHGAMVPLCFLVEAGWNGPTAILSLPWQEGDHEGLGRMLQKIEGKTAVIASGDMSHRLKPGAPGGYHKAAWTFDRDFIAALMSKNWDGILNIPTQDIAAEDVVDSTRVAIGAAGNPYFSEVISYEAPWGVGYSQAIFVDASPPLYALARMAAKDIAMNRKSQIPTGTSAPQGVFVTLMHKGKLRGCIGHIFPVYETLEEEVVRVARAAASRDPRFPKLKPSEISDLSVDISLLSIPEDIESKSELNPSTYGVIVKAGDKRGVLLPNIDGVDNIDQQVGIAARKAGIAAGEKLSLQRFSVQKIKAPS